MRKQSIAAAFGAASLLLSGCTVGPKYQRPTIDTPTVYRGAEANGNTQTSKAPHDLDGTPLPGQSNTTASTAISIGDEKWWEVFGDPQLQELIRTALKQNYDIGIAAERVLESQAQLGVTRSAEFPTLSGGGGYTAQQYPSAQFGGLLRHTSGSDRLVVLLEHRSLGSISQRHQGRARAVAGQQMGAARGDGHPHPECRNRLLPVAHAGSGA
jgi:outer membrane protein TolC